MFIYHKALLSQVDQLETGSPISGLVLMNLLEQGAMVEPVGPSKKRKRLEDDEEPNDEEEEDWEDVIQESDSDDVSYSLILIVLC